MRKRITKKVLFSETIRAIKSHLLLSDWDIVIEYDPKMPDLADCVAMPEYKRATIRFNTRDGKKLSHKETISVAVHEMTHCLVWSLGEFTEEMCQGDPHLLEMVRKLEEGLVTNIEKILVDQMSEIVQDHLHNNTNYATIDV